MERFIEYLLLGLAVLTMFGLSIFVHELGHFVAARKYGLKVEAFAIGFGPALRRWRRGGVEYSIRLLPFGGFVRLPQMITADILEGTSPEGGEKLSPASSIARIIVAFSGPLMNVLFAFLLATILYFVGLPVRSTPPIVGAVEPGSPEEKAGLRPGDQIVSVSGVAIKTWEELTELVVLAPSNTFDVVVVRDGIKTNLTLTAQRNEQFGLKWLNFVPQEHPTVGYVEADTPAAKAGLKPGDRIVSFNGVPVATSEQLIQLVSKSEGKPSIITVDRNGQILNLPVTPFYDPKTQRARIGIVFATVVYQVIKPGPPPWQQVETAFKKSLGFLTALLRSQETGIKPKHLSGPVGIIGWLAVQTRTDIRLALDFLVLLNVGLMILNLLPIPVLDGGHIIFALWEGLTGSVIPKKVIEGLATAFAMLLIGLMLYVTFFDIQRLSGYLHSTGPVREQPPPHSTNNAQPRP